MYYAEQSGSESWCAMLSPVVGNHGVLCRTSGCESWFVVLCQRFWIMVSYAEPVIVNHGVVCWDSGCESWWIMLRLCLLIMLYFVEPEFVNYCALLSQWLWIMVCFTEPEVVNHGVLFWVSCCESWCAMLSPVFVNRDVLCWAKWLWIMMCYAEPSGWESWFAMLSQW